MLVDKLTVTRPGTTTRGNLGAITDGDPVVVVDAIPCRLDVIATEGEPLEAGTRRQARHVVYSYVKDEIQLNDFVSVTRADGSSVDDMRVKNIDRPGLFRSSHLEIEIEPVGV